MRVSVVIIGLALVLQTSCAKHFTDEELLAYASQDYDKNIHRESVGESVPLGKLGRTDVVIEYKCSDVCPMDTVRVIRFELPSNMTCEQAGGRYTYFDLPAFSRQPKGGYCVPAVLMDNWEQYVK